MRLDRTTRMAVGLCIGLVAAGPVAAAPAVDVNKLDRRVERLENMLDSGQLAELIQRINSLEQDIRQLRGEIETQSHRMDELRKRQRNLYSDLDRRLRELEVAQQSGGGSAGTSGGGGASSGSSAAGASGAAAAAAAEKAAKEAAGGGGETSGDQPAAEARSGDERKAYDSAFELLKEGRYSEAAAAFRTFLEKHPDGPYADNAQYWLGESYYVTREFAKALDAFRGVSEKYPDSAKLPDARLKMGYTLYELGRMDEARTILRKVMNEHPDSAVSRLAKQRILRIEREGSNSSD